MNKTEKILAIGALVLFALVLLLVRELNITSTESYAKKVTSPVVKPRITPKPPMVYPTDEFPGGAQATPIPNDQYPTKPKSKPVPTYSGGGGYFTIAWLCKYFGVACETEYQLPEPPSTK